MASRNGSSMRAIIGAIETGRLEAEPRLVVSNRRESAALTFAAEHGVPAVLIPTLPDPDAADEQLREALAAAGVDLVVLSGYLRKLGPRTLARYHGRILNIHPALLPKFGGEGMYGRKVHEAVAASGDLVTGATVHIVDGEYDHGPIVAACEIPLPPGAAPEEIERLVTAAEPAFFVEVLGRIAVGELRLISDNIP
jgi:phosphoribosylglycinamide formyltransferase-1